MMDRREFLRRSAALGGAAAGASLLGGCWWLAPMPGPRRGTILGSPAAEAPIDTVVVVMMENRSFDHWLGWLSRDQGYLDAGRRRYGNFLVGGNQAHRYPAPDGTLVRTEHLPEQAGQTNPFRGCGFADPGHGWDAGRAQRDGGFLAPGSNNDVFALGYYREDDLPFTSQLAKRFTLCDRWHCSVLGPTYPNREYLLAGQSGGHKTNYIPIAEGGFPWPTILDRLIAAGVPVANYWTDLPQTLLWGPRLVPYQRAISTFFDDCAGGSLPNVSFVDPGFLGDSRTDDHPHADIRAGQLFLRDVFKAFATSPHWESGLLVLTYDEWGGFFDSVAPVTLPDDRASSVDSENFGQAGFRVPSVLASPFALPGYADHTLYDHTSVLRFLEWRFLGAPAQGPGREHAAWFLTARDRNANNLGATLTTEVQDLDVGFDLDVAIDTPSPGCAGEAAAPLPPAALEALVSSGYAERTGFTAAPDPMAATWQSG